MSIPVAPEMEIVATAQASALGEYLGLSRDKIDEVKLALVEACINAFEHAHCRDEQLHLTFRLGREPKGREWLEVEVLDKGRASTRSTSRSLAPRRPSRTIASGVGSADHQEPDGRGRHHVRGEDRILMRK